MLLLFVVAIVFFGVLLAILLYKRQRIRRLTDPRRDYVRHR